MRNTGRAADVPPGQPEDVSAYVGSDVYRISASGATTWLPTSVMTARFGELVPVHVFVKRAPGDTHGTSVRINVTSESDPTKTAASTCRVG